MVRPACYPMDVEVYITVPLIVALHYRPYKVSLQSMSSAKSPANRHFFATCVSGVTAAFKGLEKKMSLTFSWMNLVMVLGDALENPGPK